MLRNWNVPRIIAVCMAGFVLGQLSLRSASAQQENGSSEPVVRTKTFLHENGQKLSEGKLVDDVRDGLWTWWYDTGEEFAHLTYDMGTPVGTERHLSRTGEVVTTGEYRDGKEFNGSFVDFTGSLQVTSLRRYKDGNAHGEWQWWHEDGSVNIEGEFVDGNKNGLWTWYYPNGQKFAESNFDHGTMVKTESHWSENGDLVSTGEYRNGEPWTGTFLEFLGAELVVTSQRSFLQGEPHGDWVWKFDDGTLNTTGAFVSGNKDGKWEWWYPSGEKYAETEFANGVSKGRLSYYAENGVLLAEGIYDAQGKEVDGIFVDFTGELELTAQRSWKNGMRDGFWIEWHENGQPKSEAQYSEDRQVGTSLTWNEQGVKTSEERFTGQ
ncbi:MAG: hypothetical protein KDA93_19065 [Planctomycetaceae bacterium]|nr:hypothetical protein [Planctomycetaceae bacterium]